LSQNILTMKNVYSILLLLLLSNVAIAQNTLFGNIEDTNGEPLPGANIMLVGTDYATMSDADGFFLFRNLEVGQYQLEVSYVGFTTVEKTVNVKGKTNIDINLGQTDYEIKGVVISSWATSKTPMSYTNIDKEELEKNNLGQDVPYLLRWTPSAVITSDAGTGIGYTGIRIRGSDPSRINVTINGIPLNDSESQGVFWVDLPDFASSTESIQIQRGVGTSTNGAGAFGATIGLNTAKINKEAYGQLSNSIGSFGTIKNIWTRSHLPSLEWSASPIFRRR